MKITKEFKNQKELFEYIWETREHVSELSGDSLLNKNDYKWHWQFLHILSKGTYKFYKLNPENIILGTVKEHENQESIEKFQELKSKLRRQYYDEYYKNT